MPTPPPPLSNPVRLLFHWDEEGLESEGAGEETGGGGGENGCVGRVEGRAAEGTSGKT